MDEPEISMFGKIKKWAWRLFALVCFVIVIGIVIYLVRSYDSCQDATSDCKIAGTRQDDDNCSSETDKTDNTPCDDNNAGTTGTVCTAGVCGPPPATDVTATSPTDVTATVPTDVTITSPEDVDCVETGNTAADCGQSCGVAAATMTIPAQGNGTPCSGDYTCLAGDGDCGVAVWHLADAGESCTTTCSDVSDVSLGCTDGDWGLHDKANLTSAMEGISGLPADFGDRNIPNDCMHGAEYGNGYPLVMDGNAGTSGATYADCMLPHRNNPLSNCDFTWAVSADDSTQWQRLCKCDNSCPDATSDCKIAGTRQDDDNCSSETDKTDNTPCDDNRMLTTGTVCTAGVCGPPDVDCAGSWSPCTASCEAASQRQWTGTADQSGSGARCPVAVDCLEGDGDCRPIWTLSEPHESCTNACTSIERTCSDGDWGVRDQDSLRRAIGEISLSPTDPLNRISEINCHLWATEWDVGLPIVLAEGDAEGVTWQTQCLLPSPKHSDVAQCARSLPAEQLPWQILCKCD